jgi:S1-C subfamily serine protease
MRTVMTARRLAVFAAFAVVAVLVSVKWSPATHAQEERRITVNAPVVLWNDAGRPRLGVYVATEPADGGVRVTDVSPGGPAEGAGILAGDAIVAIGGHPLLQPLADEEDTGQDNASLPLWRLRALLDDVPEGESVEVEVERDGEMLTFDVVPERMDRSEFFFRPSLDTLGFRWRDMAEQFRDRYGDTEWPVLPDVDDRFAIITEPSRNGARGTWRIYPSKTSVSDLELVELNAGLGVYFGTDEGVLVANAAEDSPLGLQPGDVVVAVEGRKVDDSAELRRILRSYTEDEAIEFSIWRDGAETTVVGTINRP